MHTQVEKMQAEAYAHFTDPSLTDEDLKVLHTRFVLAKKRNTGVSNECQLLRVYGSIFQKCNIHTVAVPAFWLERFTEESLKRWFQKNFRGVNRMARYRYVLDGRRYVLFGSSEFIGDRARDGEETWNKDDVQQAGDEHAQEEDNDSTSAEKEQEGATGISSAEGEQEEVIVISSAEEDSDGESTEEE
jgi:hypothetical protein